MEELTGLLKSVQKILDDALKAKNQRISELAQSNVEVWALYEAALQTIKTLKGQAEAQDAVFLAQINQAAAGSAGAGQALVTNTNQSVEEARLRAILSEAVAKVEQAIADSIEAGSSSTEASPAPVEAAQSGSVEATSPAPVGSSSAGSVEAANLAAYGSSPSGQAGASPSDSVNAHPSERSGVPLAGAAQLEAAQFGSSEAAQSGASKASPSGAPESFQTTSTVDGRNDEDQF